MTTRRRLLIIAYYFPPQGMGGVQRPLKFAKYLPEFGWDVTVMTSNDTSYHALDDTLLDDIPGETQICRVESIDPAAMVRRRSAKDDSVQRATTKPGFMRQIQQWARWPDDKVHFARVASRTAQNLAGNCHFDAVYTTSPPPSIHHAGLTLQEKLGIPWIADFRDPWLVHSDDWGPTALHRRYAQNLRTRILQRADHVIAMNPLVAAEFHASSPQTRLSVIPNGYDETDFADVQLGRDGEDFTIAFYGTMTRDSGILPFFQTAVEWKLQHPHSGLHVQHIGQALDDFGHLSGAGGLIERCGYLPHKKAIAKLCAADAVVLSVPADDGYRATIPGRAYEVLRSLRPVIAYAPGGSALASLLSDSAGVWMCDPLQPAETMAALDQIVALERGAPARTVESIRQFDRRHQSSRLAEILDGMMVGGGAVEA